MRAVALPGTELAPSRLAFGSAPLMARLGRRESVRLLEVAHDSGITHFDTARSYGYGEAESAVGDFLVGTAGRGDRVHQAGDRPAPAIARAGRGQGGRAGGGQPSPGPPFQAGPARTGDDRDGALRPWRGAPQPRDQPARAARGRRRSPAAARVPARGRADRRAARLPSRRRPGGQGGAASGSPPTKRRPRRSSPACPSSRPSCSAPTTWSSACWRTNRALPDGRSSPTPPCVRPWAGSRR